MGEHGWVYNRLVEMARADKALGWKKGNMNWYWSQLRREAGPSPRDKHGFAFEAYNARVDVRRTDETPVSLGAPVRAPAEPTARR